MTPYFENFGKRVVKSPKYYFTDTGLLTYLLDIERVEQVTRDPLVGNMFENLVVLEALKMHYNQGLNPNLHFFRDSHGSEIDLIYKSGNQLTGVEIKSASTWNNGFKKSLLRFSENISPLEYRYVVYSGDNLSFSDGVEAISYKSTEKIRGCKAHFK